MVSFTQGSDGDDAHRPPDFFLVGVPRSGSTTLYATLSQHPQLYMPEQKEACYTCRELDSGLRLQHTRFYNDRDEYLALFAAARADQLIGEGCVVNIYSTRAPDEIRNLNRDARILVQMRDPIEQMYSNHALKVLNVGIAHDRFAEALTAEQLVRARRRAMPMKIAEHDLRDGATVSPGLARFIDTFGRDRVHVSLFEDFRADPQAVVRSVATFLGVDSAFEPRVGVHVPNRVAPLNRLNRAMGSRRVIERAKRALPSRLHPVARSVATAVFRINRRRTQRPALETALRDQLREEFGPEVDQLSRLVGIDLRSRWWPQP